MKIRYGIENIFRVFRIDVIWRLSNLRQDINQDGVNDIKVQKWTIKGSFNFRF